MLAYVIHVSFGKRDSHIQDPHTFRRFCPNIGRSLIFLVIESFYYTLHIVYHPPTSIIHPIIFISRNLRNSSTYTYTSATTANTPAAANPKAPLLGPDAALVLSCAGAEEVDVGFAPPAPVPVAEAVLTTTELSVTTGVVTTIAVLATGEPFPGEPALDAAAAEEDKGASEVGVP